MEHTQQVQQASNDADRYLSPQLQMGAVTLNVGDLSMMSQYYENALAFSPLEERFIDDRVHRVLGRGDTPMLTLVSMPDLPAGSSKEAGLYHTAFLFDDAKSLAATVYRAAQHERSQFVGSSDHLVSEAFYFTDPEGNGIELYKDRPRDEWEYSDDQVMMTTKYLDPNRYLADYLDEDVLDAVSQQSGKVGHVHLQVGNVPEARKFYVEALGFEPTFEGIPSALFTSAGGYHHHVAMNTWQSRGAGPRAARLGLGDVSVLLPTREDLDALIVRLKQQKISYQDTGRQVIVNDPWGTQVSFSLTGETVEDVLNP